MSDSKRTQLQINMIRSSCYRDKFRKSLAPRQQDVENRLQRGEKENFKYNLYTASSIFLFLKKEIQCEAVILNWEIASACKTVTLPTFQQQKGFQR